MIQRVTSMNWSRKLLLAVSVGATLWIGAKVFMTIGAILMKQSPPWLMKETIKR